MSVWVYMLGETTGADIKIGHTRDETMRKRLRDVNRDQTTAAAYVLLVAVHATTKDEKAIQTYFGDSRRADKGSRTEYFNASDPLVHYVNWLRSQWWSVIDEDTRRDDTPMVDPEHWLPEASRAIAPPPRDELKLVQDYEDLSDALYNTAWSWLSGQKAGVQDYFTPPEIVDAARVAMGGIDLDAASHPLANRTHRIPDYFHTGRSAFHNDWYGRVWLNPPYGNNAPWFERILQFVSSGDIEQLCMLSPMWAFQTKLARPVMDMTSGLVLLTPTPKFWGNINPDKTGSNNPHGVIYIGENAAAFCRAFAGFGMAVTPAWEYVDAKEMAE